MQIRKYLTFEILIRVVADLVIVNASYFAALIIRVLWRIRWYPEVSAQPELMLALQVYGASFWLLSIIAVVVFSASGFYTRGRFYLGRFKVVVILQAVSLVYLIFGSILYFAMARQWRMETPGLALGVAWFLTFCATAGSRLAAILWGIVIRREAPQARPAQAGEQGRRVLVVGGAGYIGSVLCRQLLNRGYLVRVLDPLLYGNDSVADLMPDPRFELSEGDSRDVGAVIRAMLGMDMVVHLGELVGDPACALDEDLTVEINLAATRMLAEAARGYGVRRFVYASSCSVYGAGTEILDERSALSPVSLYARAKIASERVLLHLNGPDFHPVVLRFATVYGMSPRLRFDLVVNLLTAKAACDGEITIFGGDQWRPFVHVADAARSIVRSLEAPLESVKGRVFNVGSDDQNYTIAAVGELIQRQFPQARLIRREADTDSRDYHISFARIRHELGFLPQYTLEQGVSEIAEALRDGSIADYRDARYSNLKTLAALGVLDAIRSRRINGLYASRTLEELVLALPREHVAGGSQAVEG